MVSTMMSVNVLDELNLPLLDICDDFKRSLDAILVNLSSLQSCDVGFTRKAEDVKGVFAGKGDQLAAF